jgi:hypothetical protein
MAQPSASDISSSTTTKEISPGILLIKQQLPGNKVDSELIYVFKVEIRRLNVLEFTADFAGSENVVLEGKSGLLALTTVEPFATQIVARLHLKKDWKLKSKFK